MKQLWDRWAPLTGLLSVACSLVGVMLVLNQPQDKDSDAKIVAYFANHSHRVQGVVGFFVVVSSVVVWATSAVALRTRVLPRWYARLGILAGVVQLFGFFFFPFFVWWLWIIVTSILLISRPSPAPARVAQPAL